MFLPFNYDGDCSQINFISVPGLGRAFLRPDSDSLGSIYPSRKVSNVLFKIIINGVKPGFLSLVFTAFGQKIHEK